MPFSQIWTKVRSLPPLNQLGLIPLTKKRINRSSNGLIFTVLLDIQQVLGWGSYHQFTSNNELLMSFLKEFARGI